MLKKIINILILFSFVFSLSLQSEQPKDYTFFVGVKTDNVNKPKIILSWSVDTLALEYTIRWKYKHNEVWSEPIAELPSTAADFTDSNIRSGTGYEYQIKKKLSTPNDAFAYVYTGINLPVNERNGKLILFVDETITSQLDYELTRYIYDLTGDGWEVIRHDVPRTEQFNKFAVQNIKDLIIRDYSYYSKDIKSIILLGRIAVPYSGDIFVDDHDPDHRGAWAADLYYGVVHGQWADTLLDLRVASRKENWNIPGDGKFDQTMLPSNVEIPVGRIDFFNLPAMRTPEIELLRNYLNKNHDYRFKKITAPHKALIDDGFGMLTNEAFAADAWLNFYALFDSSDVHAGSFRYDLINTPYLWAYGCNSGSYNSVYNTLYTWDVDTLKYNAIFTMLFGSYNGDWDSPDNVLRAAIASTPSILTCFWAGRPFWFFHRMGLNETIGDATLISQNNQYLYESTGLYGYRYVHTALMGDPTLRMYIVAPPSYFMISKTENQNSSKILTLRWQPSPDSVLGYNIYRQKNQNGNYIKLNSTLITSNFVTDTIDSNERNNYMLRAVKLDSSPTGTFFNISQGILTQMMYPKRDIKQNFEFSISIYPNPVKDYLIIEANNVNASQISITIYDVMGKSINEILRTNPSNNEKIKWDLINSNGSKVAPGVYFLRLTISNKSEIRKLLVVE